MNSEPLNPVDIEKHILGLTGRIAKGVSVCSKTHRAFSDADREFDVAYAHAYLEAEGSIKDKDMQAKIQTADLRKVRDVAEVAYKYADRLHKALDLELRAYQSIGASVRQMYGVAGRGEF